MPYSPIDREEDLAVQLGSRVAARQQRRTATPRPPVVVTAGIAAAAVALAAFASLAGPASDADDASETTASFDASHLSASLSGAGLSGVDGSLDALRDSLEDQRLELDTVRAERAEEAGAAVGSSLSSIARTADQIGETAEAIAEERAEAERLAAQAERLAAEQAEAEAAEAQRLAAEQTEADRAAVDAAATRSQEREPAPEPTPEPAPPSGDPRSTARGMLGSYGWGDDQWGCLEALWERESNWNHTAMNPSSGAYGIPQSLPGNKMATAGADWQTNPTTQIRWGLGYIQGRYGSPCSAWAHSESVGWY